MIKTKKDVELFLQNFKEYCREDDYENFEFDFSNSSLYGNCRWGGVTRLSKDKAGNLYAYNWGTNWRDSKASLIENPVEYIYERREDINREL